MSRTIEGDEVFTREKNGMIDRMFRADNQATFDAFAIAQGWLIGRREGRKTVLVQAKGANINPIASIIITPGVYDEDGKETTPPVMHPEYHVNVRLAGQAVERRNTDGVLRWQLSSIEHVKNGTRADSIKSEVGRTVDGVTELDPDSIASHQNKWFGDE